MNLINQHQVRGLVDTISYIKSQLDSLDYVSSTGGLISGDVTILNSNLYITGGISVSGVPFYLNSGDGTFGINISSPSGNIHIFSQGESASIWLESNPYGGNSSSYPSIKFLNSQSGVTSEIGIISPSTLPFTNASGNAFFINHGASLVNDESNENRTIQFAVNDTPVLELYTGKASIVGSLEINSTKFATVSGILDTEDITIDSTYMYNYRGVKYNLSIFNETGSRLEEFFMTWTTGSSQINYTGIKSPSVNSTNDIEISGYKSGNYALLRAAATEEAWTVVGIANYLF